MKSTYKWILFTFILHGIGSERLYYGDSRRSSRAILWACPQVFKGHSMGVRTGAEGLLYGVLIGGEGIKARRGKTVRKRQYEGEGTRR